MHRDRKLEAHTYMEVRPLNHYSDQQEREIVHRTRESRVHHPRDIQALVVGTADNTHGSPCLHVAQLCETIASLHLDKKSQTSVYTRPRTSLLRLDVFRRLVIGGSMHLRPTYFGGEENIN